MRPVRFLPNLGAEEGDWRRALSRPPVQALARAVAGLYGERAEVLFVEGAEPEGEPLLPWLHDVAGLVPWLSTDEAEETARALGVPYAAAPAEVVARVHEKGWAAHLVEREGLAPPALHGLSRVLDAADLADPGAAILAIDEQVATWPAWTGGRFILKPRRGTSGRGRVAGEGRCRDDVAAALPRLAQRGGALLEPWLERSVDLSAQLWVFPSGEVELLGTTVQELRGAGVYLGNRGVMTSEGQPRAGTRWDDALGEAALRVGRAAAEEGFWGAAGLDAFVFAGPGGEATFRPVVELNARFTGATALCARLRRDAAAGRAPPGTAFHHRAEDARVTLRLPPPPGIRRGGALDGSWIVKDVLVHYGAGEGIDAVRAARAAGLVKDAVLARAVEQLRFLDRRCDDLAGLLERQEA